MNRRIHRAMQERQLSTRQLGKLIGVSHTTVVQWFSQDYAPMAAQLMRLPRALRISGHWLLTGRGPRRPPR